MEHIIELLAGEDTLVIVDPVMADNGTYYAGFDNSMCDAFRKLCSRADLITPNLTEAALLTGHEYAPGVRSRGEVETLLRELASLGSAAIALTGVHLSDAEIGNAALDCKSGESFFSMRPARSGMFYGTGDLFASAMAALLVRGASPERALSLATTLVDNSISRSILRGGDRRFGVDFEGALPHFIREVEKLFAE